MLRSPNRDKFNNQDIEEHLDGSTNTSVTASRLSKKRKAKIDKVWNDQSMTDEQK